MPQAGSTVVITAPNAANTTYAMDADGAWVATEDVSYSVVVANPEDEATEKLEKLKVNNTTYANWTENEIKKIAAESGGGKLYAHNITLTITNLSDSNTQMIKRNASSSSSTATLVNCNFLLYNQSDAHLTTVDDLIAIADSEERQYLRMPVAFDCMATAADTFHVGSALLYIKFLDSDTPAEVIMSGSAAETTGAYICDVLVHGYIELTDILITDNVIEL